MDTTQHTTPPSQPDQHGTTTPPTETPHQERGGGGAPRRAAADRPMDSPGNFNIQKTDLLTPEARLVGTLGVSRNRLRELRQKFLKKGVDWVMESRAACYTETGLKKIAAHLTLPPEQTAPAPASASPEPVTLLVWQPRLVNKRMILCYLPDTDPMEPKNRVRVVVRSSENFVRFANGKPMAIKAHHVQADLYQLAGQCPRRKGWTAPK